MYLCPICERRHAGVTTSEGMTSAVCLTCHQQMKESGEISHDFTGEEPVSEKALTNRAKRDKVKSSA